MATIGVIGLGVMGKNIVLNIADHDFKVSIFNRTISKAKDLEKLSKNISGFDKIEDFVDSLAKPRKILLMVTSGQAVEECLEHLKPLLDKEDIVIDGGNSYYVDTIRRSKECAFNYVGCGISGGEYGARNGPAMFFGCSKSVYDNIKAIFETISAKHDGISCCGWMGNDGAGHFVKIVHNGIEYCEMQILQEIINLLLFECERFEDPWILKVFKELNSGSTRGYLVEICEKILITKNDDGLLLDQILDLAEQKGTGKMCIYSGVETDTAINSLTESVFARYLSSQKNRRVKFAFAVNSTFKPKLISDEQKEKEISIYKKAFHLAKAICYIQGCDLLTANKEKHHWSYDISKVCDVWREGCILRCDFLSELKKMAENDALETSDSFISIYNESIDSLKYLCKFAVENEIHCPVLLSCFSWLSGLKHSERNGTLIQAMRDYFGRHTVILKNGERKNIDWYE